MPTVNVTFAAFIVLVIGALVALVIALPVATPLDPAYLSLITSSFANLKAWDLYLPIHEGLAMLSIVLSFEFALWSWHQISRLIKFVRGSTSA